MVELRINNTAYGDMTNRVTDALVTTKSVDGVLDQEESTYINTNWSQYWGYFNTIPELKSAVLMKAIWNVGKGYTADNRTTSILENIIGWGKDTFLDILFNMEVIRRIGGDAFAEIIRDDTGILINLKPLDPETMKIVVGRNGMIKRFEQISKTGKKGVKTFKPEDIFYLPNNRLADQIHGISDIVSMEKTILAEYENFDDLVRIMHRQAKPMIMFKLGTDNPAKIATFIKKMDEAVNKGENIYVPDDVNSVSYEVVQVNISSIIMDWRRDIQNKFYRAIGLPLVIFGQAGTTESGGKIEYLAHEQVFERDQKFIEEQIWNQLAIKIDLVSPTSLLENLNIDETKDKNQGLDMPKGDMTSGVING